MSLKSKKKSIETYGYKINDMRIQSHTKINMPEVLKKASNEQNSCNVQSNSLSDV